MMPRFPDFDPIYEYDDGDAIGFLGIDIDGHGHDLDTIELLLEREVDDAYLDDEMARGWEIAESWRGSVLGGDDAGYPYFDYQEAPAPGYRAVTRLTWGNEAHLWCVNHRDEPWAIGVPVATVNGGDAVLERELLRASNESDPRRTVDPQGFIYLCCACRETYLAATAALRRNQKHQP